MPNNTRGNTPKVAGLAPWFDANLLTTGVNHGDKGNSAGGN